MTRPDPAEMDLSGFKEPDQRKIRGAAAAATIVIEQLQALDLTALQADREQQEIPEGWDPVYWRYSQELGCS